MYAPRPSDCTDLTTEDNRTPIVEGYGTLSFAQRAAYRKYNVSPSDHDDLVRIFGEDAHQATTRFVKQAAEGGKSVSRAIWEHERNW